jgi:hypothetical protein
MRPKVLSIAAYAAANAALIAASQTPAAGGVQALTLTSSPFTNDVPRQVSITSAGNDSNRIFLVEGTDYKNHVQIEAVRGANTSVAQTVRAFKTVTAIYVDGNTAAAVTAGTTTVVDTNWFPCDSLLNSFELTLVLDIPTGNVGQNVTVQLTGTRLGWKGANPTPPYSAYAASKFDRFHPTLVVAAHDTLAGETAAGVQTGNIVVPVTAIRLRSSAVFTGSPITLTVAQTGHGP